MACRKVSIYGPSHPMAQRAVEKPFFALDRVFQFRTYVNFNIQHGSLHVLNIRLKDSPFVDEIMRPMQTLELDALVFGCRLSMGDLSRFLARFVKRVTLDDHANLMSTFLAQSKIDTIEVNSERAIRMFEEHRQYRGDIEGDFSAKGIALAQMGDDLDGLAELTIDPEGMIERRYIGFTSEVISYLLPEKVTSLPCELFVEHLSKLIRESAPGGEEGERAKEALRRAWKLLDYHPEIEGIIEQVQTSAPDEQLCAVIAREAGDSVNAIRVETREQIDRLLIACLEGEMLDSVRADFTGSFRRLLTTGQRGKAIEVLSRLMDYLNSPDTMFRGRSLELLIGVVQEVDLPSETTVFDSVLGQVSKVMETQSETFEYAEFVWRLFDQCLIQRQFNYMAQLAGIIGRRRKVSGGITVYDSIGIKKIIENLNRSEIVSVIIDELVHTDNQTSGYIREILVCCGAEDTAIGLSHIISHPIRQVRQQALKILAELGKASLKVFTQILMDDSMFEREKDRQELPDAKWYVIRNSIFVLGLLQDPEGIAPLRLRINDPDIRVRREIITTLEKIGGEDACDLLIVMAEDSVKEIRERAVIAAGLTGGPDMAPLLIDVLMRNPSVAARAIPALGKLGGPMAAAFLGKLLTDGEEFRVLTEGNLSKDDLRVAVVKALGEIGDQGSLKRLREFKERQSGTAKIFFRNSVVNRMIDEVLARK